MALPKTHNSSTTESKGTEMIQMLNKEFKSLVFWMIIDLKENSYKHLNEARNSIQDMCEKINNMNKKNYTSITSKFKNEQQTKLNNWWGRIRIWDKTKGKKTIWLTYSRKFPKYREKLGHPSIGGIYNHK
jgi:uncharacterized membrane protein